MHKWEKMINWTSSKLKTFSLWNALLRGRKNKLHTGLNTCKPQVCRIYRKLPRPTPLWKPSDQKREKRTKRTAQISTWKCAHIISLREVKIKATVTFHYTYLRMAEIKNNDHTKCWLVRLGKTLDLSNNAAGNVKWYSLSGKRFGSLS